MAIGITTAWHCATNGFVAEHALKQCLLINNIADIFGTSIAPASCTQNALEGTVVSSYRAKNKSRRCRRRDHETWTPQELVTSRGAPAYSQ